MTDVTVLDGGLGQELIRRTGNATPKWSLQALLDDPQLVRQVHADFFAAGAQIATANTYSLRPDRLEHFDLGGRMQELQTLACEIACAARDAHGSGLVFSSLSPLGYSYQPHLAPPSERAAVMFAEMAAMQAPLVDGILLETMSSVDEARGALMGTADVDVPVWLAVSVSDADGSKLRSGEPVADVLTLVDEFRPAALLVNCSVPEAVSQALPHLAGVDIPLGAYANGFTGIHDNFNNNDATVDLLKARTDLDPAAYLTFAKGWAESGATLIGGCCEVGPDHIAALSAHFNS